MTGRLVQFLFDLDVFLKDTDKDGLHGFTEVFDRINETELSRNICGNLFESVPALK